MEALLAAEEVQYVVMPRYRDLDKDYPSHSHCGRDGLCGLRCHAYMEVCNSDDIAFHKFLKPVYMLWYTGQVVPSAASWKDVGVACGLPREFVSRVMDSVRAINARRAALQHRILIDCHSIMLCTSVRNSYALEYIRAVRELETQLEALVTEYLCKYATREKRTTIMELRLDMNDLESPPPSAVNSGRNSLSSTTPPTETSTAATTRRASLPPLCEADIVCPASPSRGSKANRWALLRRKLSQRLSTP